MIVDKVMRLLALFLSVFLIFHGIIWQVPLLKALFEFLYGLFAPIYDLNAFIAWMFANLELYVPVIIVLLALSWSAWPYYKRLKIGLLAALITGVALWLGGF